MEFKINYQDMFWAALSPEFTLLSTAFFLLLIGLKKKFNTKKVLLNPSCTKAIEMAYILSKVTPGDEVIMPSFACSISLKFTPTSFKLSP